jgi:beta-ureidopropionase
VKRYAKDKEQSFMKNNEGISRRNFIRQTSLGLGAGIVGVSVPSCKADIPGENKKLPGEVCVVSVDLKGLWHDTTRESRIKNILDRMKYVAGLQPDIICLPELFDTIWISENFRLSEVAEDEKIPGPVTGRIAEFANKHNCYIVCPVYTKKEGHFYNSSLLIDRKGSIAGVYNKIHPVKSEILPDSSTKDNVGIIPGALDQPVIETDFGKVGMQICYDANWSDGWDNLKKKGAEIIIFSSAFPGGRMLNYYAWRNGCYIISSTGGDARVVDMSGNDLHSSSTFVRYAWANINLEKVNTDTWPTNDRLPDLFNKYGNRLGIKVWDNTGVITIESRDPRIKVRDVLREFNIQTIDENIKSSEEVQDKYRL